LRRVERLLAGPCVRKHQRHLLRSRYFLLAAIVGSTLLSVGCGSSERDIRSPSVDILAQEAEERILVRVPTDTLRIDVPAENLFFRSVRLLPDSSILVYDESNMVLLRVNTQGSVEQVIGRGPGSGPGEHTEITNYGFLPQGNFWTYDSKLNRITLFRLDGRLSQTTPLDVNLPQAEIINEYIFGYTLSGGGVLIRMSSEGSDKKAVASFGSKRDSDVVLTGPTFLQTPGRTSDLMLTPRSMRYLELMARNIHRSEKTETV